MDYNVWDHVTLKICVAPLAPNPDYHPVDVVVLAVDSQFAYNSFICYVTEPDMIPSKANVTTYKITESTIKKYNIDRKFLGDWGCSITMYTPIFKHIPAIPGEKCEKCKEFIQGAQRTSSDTPYRCRPCRLNPYR